MGLFESHEEKKLDIRNLDRARMLGKIDKKTYEQMLKAIPDDAAHSITVNIDEINAKDNPED